MRKSLDFKCLFESVPGLFLVLDPELRVVAASDDFIRVTMTRREDILGKAASEIFQNVTGDSTAAGARNLRNSLQRVLQNRVRDTLSMQKYHIRNPGREGSGVDERYCSMLNSPVFAADGSVAWIINRIEDITRIKQLEHEVLEIGGHELQRIGQELHDDVCQWLSGSVMVATVLAKDLARESSAHAERAKEVATLTRHTLESLRALAHGLTPAVVQSEGLACSLLKLAKTIEEVFHIQCYCDFNGPVEVRDDNAALHLYRIAQEAITNAVRHGRAREVSISLQPHEDRILMLIRDDGTGIRQPLQQTSGMGLRSMGYRAGLIGATLEIQPGRNGGTDLICSFPKAL